MSVRRLIQGVSLLLGLSALSLSAQAVGVQGFRGVAWGEGVARLEGARLVSEQGEVRCYMRSDEPTQFGSAALTQVRYCFQRDRLFGVVIDSQANAEQLVKIVAQIYGAPRGQVAHHSHWGDSRSLAQLQIEARDAHAPARLLVSSNRYGVGADW